MKDVFEKVFNNIAIETNAIHFEDKGKMKYSVTLIESENLRQGLHTIQLLGFNEIYFVLKYDKCKFLDDSPNKLLIADNIRKACDYIIWTNFQGHKLLLLIEMKSRHNAFTTQKFKSTKAFLSYLNSLIQEYKELYNHGINKEFRIISLLINEKGQNNDHGRKIVPNNENGVTFYNIGVNNNEVHYINRDFEQILKFENL